MRRDFFLFSVLILLGALACWSFHEGQLGKGTLWLASEASSHSRFPAEAVIGQNSSAYPFMEPTPPSSPLVIELLPDSLPVRGSAHSKRHF